MKIPFTGNPKPTVKWTKDGEELSGRNFTQEVTDRHAILTVKEANKDGGGPYHLKLENDLGSDSATINIQVNGQCWIRSICILSTFRSTFNIEY